MKRVPLRLFFLLVISLAVFRVSLACSFPPPNAVEKYKWSKNIVALKVLSLEDSPAGDMNAPDTGHAVLKVERVFKGDMKPGQELDFYHGRISTCTSYRFRKEDIGQEMLFYLPAGPTREGRWEANGEMRGSLHPGSTDMFYLKNVDKYRERPLFFGSLWKNLNPDENEPPLSGHLVTITGNGKSYKTRTDKNGIYMLADLPPGRYEVVPDKVKGFKPWGAEFVCEVKQGEHFQKDVTLTIDNSITGKVTDARGAALGRIHVSLIPADAGPPAEFPRMADTDHQGVFKFNEVGAGEYLLMVNRLGIIASESPFRPFYYPGTFKREEAVPVAIGPGTELTNMNMVSPETLDVIYIRGTLVNEAGEPVPNDMVSFYEDRGTPDSAPKPVEQGWQSPTLYTITDEKGQFAFTFMRGRKGWIRSSFYVSKAFQEGCPKMLARFAELGTDSLWAVSQTVRFEGEEDATGIELKFAHPVCRRVGKPPRFQVVERTR